MKEERISNYVKLCEEWAHTLFEDGSGRICRKRVPELKEENGFSHDRFISDEDMG